jgi:hypothetical protein
VGENLRGISYFRIRLWALGLLTVVSCLIPQLYAVGDRDSACQADLPTLTDRLLLDLPSYANRVLQRVRKPNENFGKSTYVILAGNPEFKPIPLTSRQYAPALPDDSKQVFFTTLERQYSHDRIVKRQNYHWLFLAQAEDGWRLVTIYTQFGSSSGEKPPTPPQETSDGAIGQAIRLWLRDCRAGAIF